jgi:hypothetical protein
MSTFLLDKYINKITEVDHISANQAAWISYGHLIKYDTREAAVSAIYQRSRKRIADAVKEETSARKAMKKVQDKFGPEPLPEAARAPKGGAA